MLFTLILLLALAAVVADIIHYRRCLRQAAMWRRMLFIVWAAVTDSLPFVAALIGINMRDNSTALMDFTMWTFGLWMLTVLPRIAYYFFNFFGLRRTGTVVGIAITVFFIWGMTCGRTSLVVNRIEICSTKVPESFDGFRIVQFTDTHLGTLVRPERELTRIADSINALRPDLVVYCGDLVNIRSSELDGRARRILSGIEATYGVVSVTGNHDAGYYIRDTLTLPAEVSLQQVINGQREMGWRVLMDTTEYIVRGGDSISVTGIAYDSSLRKRRHDPNLPPADLHDVYRGVPPTLFNVTAAHLPQLWTQIAETSYGDLTLSGHVHSMQMKLRLFGREYSPAQWIYERWSGRYDENGKTLYINDGTGYVAYPMRLGAYPEITLITLKKCE